MTVGELLERMDSAELSEWMAFSQVEAMPDPWLQTGVVCATMANLWAKGSHTPDQFMPRVGRRRQSVDEQVAAWRGVCAIQAARAGSGQGQI